MTVILILIAASLCIAGGFLAAFIWATRNGQFDDMETPSMRVLMDDSIKLTGGKVKKGNHHAD